MKRGLDSFSAIQVASFRLIFAGICLFPFSLRFYKQVKSQDIIPFVVVTLFGNGFPYFFFALAQTHLGSAITGMLNSLVPLFTLLIGIIVFNTPTNWQKTLGVVLGLGGALLLISSTNEQANSNWKYGMLVVAATLCYAISINTLKARLSRFSPIATSSIPLSLSAVPLIFYILIVEPVSFAGFSESNWFNLGAVALLGIVGTAVALIIFNRLIQLESAVFASTVTYLIPVVATFWGFLDGEKIQIIQILGLLVILTAVYLANQKRKKKQAIT